MKTPPSFGNVLATAIGWIALLLYILACRPSWSPDGTKLLVPYFDPEREPAGVAMIETSTGVARNVFVRSAPTSDDFMAAQWLHDGEHFIVWFTEDEFVLLPADTSAPVRSYALPDTVEFSWQPIPQIGDHLYFSGDAVVRVDLVTGEAIHRLTDRDVNLYQTKDTLIYLADDESSFELGEVDQEELTFNPFLTLEASDLEARGIDSLIGYLAFEPNGERFVATASIENGARLLLCDETGIAKVLAPTITPEPFLLGAIEWSPTRDVLYVVAFSPSSVEDETQFSVAEISIVDASTRLIPLARIADELTDDEGVGIGEIALSPDGATLAASLIYLDEDSVTEDTGNVFFVDLQSPERAVRRIPLPEQER